MKLSELQNEKDRINEIDRLHTWRGEVATALRAFDDGLVEAVYPRLLGPDLDDGSLDDVLPNIHPSAWPALRAALDQTMQCIEADLVRLGVEIDEPALVDTGGDEIPDDAMDSLVDAIEGEDAA